jgi:hypothetical protein
VALLAAGPACLSDVPTLTRCDALVDHVAVLLDRKHTDQQRAQEVASCRAMHLSNVQMDCIAAADSAIALSQCHLPALAGTADRGNLQ